MDPDAALETLRRSVNELEHRPVGEVGEDMLVDRIIETFTALDEWLSKGGFLPNAWHQQIDYLKLAGLRVLVTVERDVVAASNRNSYTLARTAAYNFVLEAIDRRWPNLPK